VVYQDQFQHPEIANPMGDFVQECAFEESNAAFAPLHGNVRVDQHGGVWASGVGLWTLAVDEVAPIPFSDGGQVRVLHVSVLDRLQGGKGGEIQGWDGEKMDIVVAKARDAEVAEPWLKLGDRDEGLGREETGVAAVTHVEDVVVRESRARGRRRRW
jgi:hypothetical protein